MEKGGRVTTFSELWYGARNGLVRWFYQAICKPFFFLFDPERVHDRMIASGAALGKSTCGRRLTRFAFAYSNRRLEQSIRGLRFRNPVGLAAGFDKNAVLTKILPAVGFGFMEVGSVTGRPCAGNPGQKLWRLKKSESIGVNYGLKNVGCEVISRALSKAEFEIPLGISLAKTNSASTESETDGIADYIRAYRAFAETGVGDYYTLNISCPNAHGGQPFLEPDALSRLLDAFSAARASLGDSRPVFLKLSADMYPVQIDAIIDLARRHALAGFICSNLTKNRKNKRLIDDMIPDRGGFSGAVVRGLSDNLVRSIYHKTGREFVIIGCGGIFSAEDAYAKIKAGASLVQLITGMIFRGPQLISDINRGLARLLEQDGFSSISDAIGSENR